MDALQTILKKNVVSITDLELCIAFVSERLAKPDTAKLAAEQLNRLQAENRSLRLALRFYANGNNWTAESDGYCPINADCGAKARLALATLGGVR